MDITLTPEIERELVEEARKLGVTPESLALAALRDRFVTAGSGASNARDGQTLAEALGNLIGVLDSSEFVPGGARMSEDIREKFTDYLVEKRRQGRL
jgi:hypothetical protein